jgi:hypothetical protein
MVDLRNHLDRIGEEDSATTLTNRLSRQVDFFRRCLHGKEPDGTPPRHGRGMTWPNAFQLPYSRNSRIKFDSCRGSDGEQPPRRRSHGACAEHGRGYAEYAP